MRLTNSIKARLCHWAEDRNGATKKEMDEAIKYIESLPDPDGDVETIIVDSFFPKRAFTNITVCRNIYDLWE